ncbi:Integrase, catalytic core protein [Phytophthora megakarya]|uniref:Integrase, catalytic core protein n=1 Tax=Phytophthora megakarya TaxID=4795 RepID=A0A225WQB3_9STRA|nr:Integrase, catalytic core protein [Phytophthora megakarya]
MDVRMQKDVRICSYSDADYANDLNVLSYAFRKQEVNALSTFEAEYVAMSEATKDLLWLVGLCKQPHWTHPVPLLYGDNQGAIALTSKPGKHSKSKHIDNKHHMVRYNVEINRIDTQHVGTDAMMADVLTNACDVALGTFAPGSRRKWYLRMYQWIRV